MGAITIKIPQDTNGAFEITDRDAADRLIRQLKKSALPEKKSEKKKKKDFSKLSKLMDEYRANPDAETTYAIKTAEKWRKRWRR